MTKTCPKCGYCVFRIAAINRRIEKLSAEADYDNPKDVRKRSKLVRRLIMERTKLYFEGKNDGGAGE